MSIVSKSYENAELNLSLDAIISKQTVYFKGKEVALALGYQNPKEAVTDHVRGKHKIHFRDFVRGAIHSPLKMHPDQVLITEPGIYSLIFGSKMPTAEKFQDWVCEEVLPSIRKYGQYKAFDNPNQLVFKIENEFDLHTKVVNYVKRFYSLLIIAGLGELQDTKSKRIKSWQKGYQKGQPDIIIQDHHKHYSGFCIELKTPQGSGTLSDAQRGLLEKYKANNYKVLISNDYDTITREITEYCKGIRIPCPYCPKDYISEVTLSTHLKWFHRISPYPGF